MARAAEPAGKKKNLPLFFVKKTMWVSCSGFSDDSLSVAPIEVKSGGLYDHSALNAFVKNEDYHIKQGYVLDQSMWKRFM